MEDDTEARLDRFEAAIGELRGHVAALETQLTGLLNRAPAGAEPADKYAGLKTAITFMAIVIVPIMVALLGGYFALKSAGLR